MAERIPPQNVDAEKSVLGAAMLNKDVLLDIMEILRPSDFYDPKHGAIYKIITELFRDSRPVDTLTVCEELNRTGDLNIVGGRAYVAQLATDVPSTANAAEYAKIVAEKSVLRHLIEAAEEIAGTGYGDCSAEQALDNAEKRIFEIAQKRQHKDYTPIGDVLLQNLETIDKLAESDRKITGITTGFKDLDNMLSGLQKSDLVILAARPSMGKTSLALNIAQKAAYIEKAKVLVFSLEMGQDQIGQRLLSLESGVDLQKIKTGRLGTSDWADINEALANISACDLFIDDTPGISILEMKNKARRMQADKGLDLILIDYLQLMTFEENKSEGRQQEVSTLCRYLKQMARELECPVIVLSQLSRAADQRPDHRPQLSDLRESGSIEQDADVVLFIYREDYYDRDLPKQSHCEILIAKHRNGPTGSVRLSWQSETTKFGDWIGESDENLGAF